ncbi:hypothetical protein H8A97_12995 [Bradyrhizobium sp. Arg62]|uniref:hypothetical protein n=1 Tax=Bradyrhizobium brasilense TaxID=1419277 RepID=UPI001E64D43F|nr:hypothetical protein [Bradyrhizobium brasilense]MCC8945990.1 hypothetical protein [Bradyrhizobium brasilense]
MKGKDFDPLSFDKRDGTVDAPLGEPHGSMLAFLSDLDEQVEQQLAACIDPMLRKILEEVRAQILAAAFLVKSAGEA